MTPDASEKDEISELLSNFSELLGVLVFAHILRIEV